ncbi:MAG: nitrilase-related carbon-nitrogen hydrolase [Candidatus Hermodarchaeota archaeon]|jgi:beta-ureidopropionase|nr:nitrilase-related carbon-nitrogen hydrolase [Candidatus Hermodarchaeota archaeon]
MKVAAAQMHPKFAQPEVNRKILRRVIHKAGADDVDLIVFPELCVSGYNFTSFKQVQAMAEPVPDGPSTLLLQTLAEEYEMIIVAGLAEYEAANQLYNSAVIVGPDGFVGNYRKIHLFDREKKWFTPGQRAPQVWNVSGVILGALVCFDWAFPEASRILMLEGCEILCLPANLVLPYAQRTMSARSIENRIFTILANRVGSERTLTFTGHSQITNTHGEVLAKGALKRSGLIIAEINPVKARDKFLTRTNHIIEDRRVELYSRLLQK